MQRAVARDREGGLRRRAAVEQIAAPIRDVWRPFGEAPLGPVSRGLERLRRLQRPEREIVAAGARRQAEALAGAEMRLGQHLLDLRSAVPGVPGLLLRRVGEVAADDVDEGHFLA